MKKVLISGVLMLGFATVGFAADETKATQTAQPETKTVAVQDTSAATGDFSNVTCKNGDMVRKVEIISAQTGCEVHYKKESEQPGHDQVLWNAKADTAFCQSKAKEFVSKLAGWGWNCGEQASNAEQPKKGA